MTDQPINITDAAALANHLLDALPDQRLGFPCSDAEVDAALAATGLTAQRALAALNEVVFALAYQVTEARGDQRRVSEVIASLAPSPTFDDLTP